VNSYDDKPDRRYWTEYDHVRTEPDRRYCIGYETLKIEPDRRYWTEYDHFKIDQEARETRRAQVFGMIARLCKRALAFFRHGTAPPPKQAPAGRV